MWPVFVRFIVPRIIKRFPFAFSLFCLHTLFDGWIYRAWATSTDGKRDMIWLLAFVIDRPLLSIYQVIRPESGRRSLQRVDPRRSTPAESEVRYQTCAGTTWRIGVFGKMSL